MNEIFNLSIRKTCLLLLLCYGHVSLYSQDTLLIDLDGNNFFVESQYMSIYEDSTQSLTIDQVRHPDFAAHFVQAGVGLAYSSRSDWDYWIRFSIQGEALSQKDWLLELGDPRINYFEVYYLSADGHLVQGAKVAGMDMPFYQREYQHKNYAFDLPSAEEKLTIFVRIRSFNPITFLFKIRSHEFFTFYALYEYFILGLFYGILLIMAIYNLLLFFTFRENFYLFYVLYVLSCIFLSFSEDGLGFQFIWQGQPGFNHFVIYYSPLLFLLSFAIYSISFLEIRKRLPIMYQFVVGFVVLASIYFFIRIQNGAHNWSMPIYVLPFIFIYLVALKSYLDKFRPARFFLFAYTFTMVGITITVLRRNMFLVFDNIIIVYILNFGILIEVLFLSLAQADKFRMIKQEKELAQEDAIRRLREINEIKDRINKEIEQQVVEKTGEIIHKNDIIEKQHTEIQEAYQQLRKQADEIERINKLLNAENKELQVNVKELTKARIFANEVDFSEFKKIFPNDDSCFEYLDQLKWNDGYECQKCSNNRHTDGQGHFARRCTRCGHNESATAHTLFHRVHFPILKGFYMLFLVYANKEKITSAELSSILDLRQNTCWKFSKKIKERLKNTKLKQNSVEKQGAGGWASLILDDER